MTGNPESGLQQILDVGIRNPETGIRNPDYWNPESTMVWNPESRIVWNQESAMVLDPESIETKDGWNPDPEAGIQDPETGIRNPGH